MMSSEVSRGGRNENQEMTTRESQWRELQKCKHKERELETDENVRDTRKDTERERHRAADCKSRGHIEVGGHCVDKRISEQKKESQETAVHLEQRHTADDQETV